MKFRKRPVEVEAWQYIEADDKTSIVPPLWLVTAFRNGTIIEREDNKGKYLLIKTLEGAMTASIGDWIIKGVKGELYSCKPDIFEATYEIV
jgi:hypothetical protein